MTAALELMPTFETVHGESPIQQRVESYISSLPPTIGLYDGSLAHNGVYVSPGAISPEYGDRPELPSLVEVEMLPGALAGAGASHHEVMFVRVQVRRIDGTSEVDAAIKPFDAASRQAEHEHDCLLAAKERGLDTFDPLALARDGDMTYLITQRRAEPHTLDNNNWTVSPSDTARYGQEVIPNLHFMASNIALMHSKGLFHGDAQAKNLARTDDGGFVVVDLENTRLANGDEELVSLMNGGDNVEESLAFQDLFHCWYALIHPTGENDANMFLEGESVDTCMAEFTKNFVEPYVDALQTQTSPEIFARFEVNRIVAALYDKTLRTT